MANQKAAKNWVVSLMAFRQRGKIDKRTTFGRAFEARKKDYEEDLGGDVSVMLAGIVEDSLWTEFYIAAYNHYLAGLKSLIRKGRLHPIADARTKIAAHKQ